MQHFIVDEPASGKRLDVFLSEMMPRLSRAFVQKLCDTDKVMVNNVPARSGAKVREGQEVTVHYDLEQLGNIPSIDLPIIYEDNDCLVINKPAGILTHAPGDFHAEPSVASFLRDKLQDLEGSRGGIVHRLDRATSGVLICAKNQAALSFLQKQFAQRKVKKIYMAIVTGTLKHPEAVIDMPIERNPKAPATFRVGANGKPSVTAYHVLQHDGTYSLLELKPTTGRTHQLRVHLAAQGHPIVGDPIYGSGKFGDRLYLHALSLEITTPDRERRTFVAPIPVEFDNLMNQG